MNSQKEGVFAMLLLGFAIAAGGLGLAERSEGSG